MLEWILYGLMAFAAIVFALVDTTAEFDGREDTRTATYWVKRFRGTWYGTVTIVAALAWLTLHFLWDDFPL